MPPRSGETPRGDAQLNDWELLDRAKSLGRVLFTRDADLLVEARRRQQRRGHAFAGVIYAQQLQVTLGQCIRDLELIAHVGEPDDFTDRVYYLPRR